MPSDSNDHGVVADEDVDADDDDDDYFDDVGGEDDDDDDDTGDANVDSEQAEPSSPAVKDHPSTTGVFDAVLPRNVIIIQLSLLCCKLHCFVVKSYALCTAHGSPVTQICKECCLPQPLYTWYSASCIVVITLQHYLMDLGKQTIIAHCTVS